MEAMYQQYTQRLADFKPADNKQFEVYLFAKKQDYTRLTDGQFDESDLTMCELELIERSLVKTLLGIYHGRIAYPSTASIVNPNAMPQPATATARSA